jgi:eukaryotic-like serine/threonine-protein kinase
MSGDRWQRVNDLFHAVIEREGAARDTFLREACGADEALYAEVVSLIAADSATPAVPLERLAEQAAADWASGPERVSLVGQRVDRYQVVAHLGSGGMGDVYRATDSVLGRDVALKVLAPALDTDADFRRRLEKEARAASSLNHPNIVTVYEIGQAGAIDFVASEFVDGVTLRQRLATGPLSVREIVDIVSQIAAALATAHAEGIVHRDIKPENVMIRRDGIVKVVDFGLAKRTGPRAAMEPASVGSVRTQAGVVAGTSCYMSPEQALGEPIDQRSDLFSVGILLYEMATGQRPFSGASDAGMYNALLHTAPPAPTSVRGDLPVDLNLVIGRALEKDRELRYQSAADLGADLKRLQRLPALGSVFALGPVRLPRTRAWQAAAMAALLLLLASALAITLVTRRPPSGTQTTRFVLGPPPNTVFTPIGLVPASVTVSVSPDGRQVLYAANRPGDRRRLWLRSIDSVEAIPIDDTEGGIFPFWSPDGRSIAFSTGGVLKRKDLAGGPSRTLVENVIVRGGTWNRDGVILYAAAARGIFRVSADGGAPTAVTNPDVSRAESHTFPQFLPDGQHFLYLARSQGTPRVFVGSLDGRVSRHVLDSNARVSYAEPGFLFVVGDDGALLARRFDASRLEITGEAMPVVRRVAISSVLDASFAVGGATLVYAEATAGTSQLTWFDRSGRRIGTVGSAAQHMGVRLSPDGTRAAVIRMDPSVNTPDLWLIDLARGAESRFTFGPQIDLSPVWSPDSARVAFSSKSDTNRLEFQVYERAAAGGADDRPLFKSDESTHPEDWSPDGRFLVYSTNPPAYNNDLKLLRLSDRRTTALVASRFSEYEGRVSPDGRWLAYTSEETGRPEVYVRAFPEGTSSALISIGGGSEASWRRDGQELFYVAPGGGLMAVGLTRSGGIKASRPTELFRAPISPERRQNGTRYASSADGLRFLIPTAVGDPPQTTLTVIVNWSEGLKQRVPAR